jgi:integrase
VRRDGDGSGTLVFSEPKNNTRRAVGLPPRAVRALREHRKRQLKEKVRAGVGWQDNGLVFTTSKGTPLEAQNVVSRSFKPLLGRAGLPPIRFHDLRHLPEPAGEPRGAHKRPPGSRGARHRVLYPPTLRPPL